MIRGAGYVYKYSHSHPLGTNGAPRPSGFTPSDSDYGGGDKAFVSSLRKDYQGETVHTNVYDVNTQSYINYTPNGYSVPAKKK
jgi:hypothetical protein